MCNCIICFSMHFNCYQSLAVVVDYTRSSFPFNSQHHARVNTPFPQNTSALFSFSSQLLSCYFVCLFRPVSLCNDAIIPLLNMHFKSFESLSSPLVIYKSQNRPSLEHCSHVFFIHMILDVKGRNLDIEKLFAYRAVPRSFLSM